MDPMTASALIGAGSSLLGGLFSNDANEEAMDQAYKRQKEFAQMGVQWKVADAKKAGVHPLYALGANTMSFSPTVVGDSLGPALADMGQNIGRAVEATGTASDRANSKIVAGLALERAGLENDLLRAQIATQRSQLGPPMPVSDSQKTVVLPDGTVLPARPNVSSAQAAEDRSGEISDIPYGYAAIKEYLGQSPYLEGTRKEMETIVRNLNVAREFLGIPARSGY